MTDPLAMRPLDPAASEGGAGPGGDPTARLRLDFPAFVERRERLLSAHHSGGVPDYAFSLDHEIRRRLDRVVPLRMLAEALTAGTVPVQRALYQVKGVVVGPKQLPAVHAMGVRCAEKLGIGVPQLFIANDARPNAFTFATSHVDQMVVLTSGLIQALDEEELLNVIGHECGHIHNRHVIYNTVWELLTNGLARTLLHTALAAMGPAGWLISLIDAVFSAGSWYVFGKWHRCAEITCDRAGLICSGDVAAAKRVMGRIHMGDLGGMEGFSADAYRDQASGYQKSWLRFTELTMTHPPGPKRTQAIEGFGRCEVLGRWRPELALTEPVISREALDRQIEDLLL